MSGTDPTTSMVEEVAKETLLPPSEVKLWIDNLKTVDANRRRGAAKAAETRRTKPKLQANVICTTVEYVVAHIWKKRNTVRTGLAVITAIHGFTCPV